MTPLCRLCTKHPARPGLRICNRCYLEEGDDGGDLEVRTSRMSAAEKSRLTIHWIHLYLAQKKRAAAAARTLKGDC